MPNQYVQNMMDWNNGSCKIDYKVQEQDYLDDVASLDGAICEDDYEDISNEDYIELCEETNIFEN